MGKTTLEWVLNLAPSERKEYACAQLRENIPYDLLPIHLISTILGDIFTLYLLAQKHTPNAEEIRAALDQRLSLLYLAELR